MNAAEAVLEGLGQNRLSAATVALLLCPRDHRLARLIDAGIRGTLLVAEPRLAGMHTRLRRPRLTRRRESTPDVFLVTPDEAEFMAKYDAHTTLPATCACGTWGLPSDYLLELVANPQPRDNGAPRLVIDSTRVSHR